MNKDKGTIFGVRSGDKIFLGKEGLKDRLRIKPEIEEVWGGIYVVCNGVVGDYQRLIKEARKIAKEDELEMEEVSVKRIVNKLSKEVNELSRSYKKRNYNANLIFGSPRELIYLDATKEGAGAIYKEPDFGAVGDKSGEVSGFLEAKEIKSIEDFEGLDKILEEYEVQEMG